ncbi:MAG: hypothetical protein H0U49_09370 [Parachlamydiaceae bacterium]|nr:hypothetical protein [Parachlamydiaceae bacterium]
MPSEISSVISISNQSPSTPAAQPATWGNWFCRGVKATAWTAALGTTVVASTVVAFQTRAIINSWAPKLILDYAMEKSEKIVEGYLREKVPYLAGGWISSISSKALGGAVVGPSIAEMARPFVEKGAYAAAAITGGITAKVMNSTFNAISNYMSQSNEVLELTLIEQNPVKEEETTVNEAVEKEEEIQVVDSGAELTAAVSLVSGEKVSSSVLKQEDEANTLLPSTEEFAYAERLVNNEQTKKVKGEIPAQVLENKATEERFHIEPTLHET